MFSVELALGDENDSARRIHQALCADESWFCRGSILVFRLEGIKNEIVLNLATFNSQFWRIVMVVNSARGVEGNE